MAKYSDETRAAVLAAIASGDSIRHASEEFGVPTSTISEWKKKHKARRKSVRKNRPKKNKAEPAGSPAGTEPATLDELLVELVREKLITLREQLQVFRDPEYLKKQPAGEAAILYGVIADKAIRILEAYDGGPPDPPDDRPLLDT